MLQPIVAPDVLEHADSMFPLCLAWDWESDRHSSYYILIKYTITPSSFDRNHAKPLITYYYYISFSFLFLFFFSLGIILHISLAIRVRPAELCTTVSARTNMVLLVYKVKKKTIAEHWRQLALETVDHRLPHPSLLLIWTRRSPSWTSETSSVRLRHAA